MAWAGWDWKKVLVVAGPPWAPPPLLPWQVGVGGWVGGRKYASPPRSVALSHSVLAPRPGLVGLHTDIGHDKLGGGCWSGASLRSFS